MNGPLFEQTWIPFNQGCIVPSLVEIGPVVLEIFEFVSIFSLFLNYFHLEKCTVLHWNKLESSSPKKIGSVVQKKTFKILNSIFAISWLSPPWKRAGPFIWKNLNPLHPRIHDCAKFGWNWLSGSGEEYFYNFITVFWLFRNFLPLEKAGPLHLNKFESPLPKEYRWIP